MWAPPLAEVWKYWEHKLVIYWISHIDATSSHRVNIEMSLGQARLSRLLPLARHGPSSAVDKQDEKFYKRSNLDEDLPLTWAILMDLWSL